MSIDFYADLVALMPKIRVQALALSRNRAAADDLVQDAAMHALAARDSFTPGTNFRASMYRILRNRFISGLRKRRDVIGIEDAPLAALAVPDSTEDHITLQELQRALGNLLPAQREALFMIVLQDISYGGVGAATNCAVGTAKSRVYRARWHLAACLFGDADAKAGLDGGAGAASVDRPRR